METTVEQKSHPPTLDPQTRKIIEFRFNQTNPSKLAEIFTGLQPEDPEMIDTLIETQSYIYQKYQLPDIASCISEPGLFSDTIKQIIKKNNISFLTQEETKQFFEENPNTYAAYFPQKKGIGLNTNLIQKSGYQNLTYPIALIHETVHALQYSKLNINPENISIEELEFEATLASNFLSPLANQNIRNRLSPEQLTIESYRIFTEIDTSIGLWEKQGGSTNRHNYSPENMLKKIDHISDEQVQLFKQLKTPA